MSAPDVPDLPVTRGDHPDWWSVHDQAILNGELAKLQNLPRPAYMERDRDQLTYRPIAAPRPRRRRAARIGLNILVVGLIALSWLVLWAAMTRP